MFIIKLFKKLHWIQFRHVESKNNIHNVVQSAIIPSRKESPGLFRNDGTFSNAFEPSHLHFWSSVAELAAKNKLKKYKGVLEQNFILRSFDKRAKASWLLKVWVFNGDFPYFVIYQYVIYMFSVDKIDINSSNCEFFSCRTPVNRINEMFKKFSIRYLTLARISGCRTDSNLNW